MRDAGQAPTPSGLRDTQTWYLDADALAVVDRPLADYVYDNGGQELLDLGCGLGGYAKTLATRGRQVIALDVNEKYVAAANRIGVDARWYDGNKIPLPDRSVDTVFMIEVLEHVADPKPLLAELRRVARRNLIVTVPNCGQKFRAPVVFDHMLDVDHKSFFSADTLRNLLAEEFREVNVIQVAPIDRQILADLLPNGLFGIWNLARKLRLIEERYYFRLIANALV